ncbi:MAG: 8-oxo-dGTP diphosphatase [Solobacterium sp.]|nr:8-oxo-dGTP diphosphatase [Solobacterium sp.]
MRITTQIYLIDHGKWLMMYRNRKKNDVNEGKWIGIGGKLEPGETEEECAVRETFEETGLTAECLDFRGIVYFIYEDHEPEKIYVYTCSRFHGEMHESSEGTLAWIDREDITGLDLWEGDKVFLKIMMETSEKFVLELHYDPEGRLKSAVRLESQNESAKNQ